MKSPDTKLSEISPVKRVAYTLVGLLAGNVMLLFFLLQGAIHATLLGGEPAAAIADALQAFVFYAIFSFVGWLLAGLPAALIFPASSIIRLRWPVAIVVGAALGPPALLVIFLLLAHSHVYFHNLAETGTLFAYSALVSAVAFVVYFVLLRREMKAKPVTHATLFRQA